MKVNWINEKETLERLISEGVSYEKIGRQYNVSGTAIKKAAKKLGIKLEPRRKINSNEHFNKGKKQTHICLNCGKEFEHKYGANYNKYCSRKCQGEHKHKIIIEKWKNGEYKGSSENISVAIKKYLLENLHCLFMV